MTPAQQNVLEAIKDLYKTKGRCPTFSEIGEASKLRSSCTVHKHVYALIRQGFLTRSDTSIFMNLVVVPDHLVGFHSCEQGHERIWYAVGNCPCCKVMGAVARVLEVSSIPLEVKD